MTKVGWIPPLLGARSGLFPVHLTKYRGKGHGVSWERGNLAGEEGGNRLRGVSKRPKDSQQVKKRKQELDPGLLALSLCAVAFLSSAPG